MKRKIANILPKSLKMPNARKKAIERLYYIKFRHLAEKWGKHHAKFAKNSLKFALKKMVEFQIAFRYTIDKVAKRLAQKPTGFRVTKKITRRPRRW